MSKHIEILHNVSCKLAEIENELQVYQTINDGLEELLPTSFFVTTKLNPSDLKFNILHRYGFSQMTSRITELLGKDAQEIDFYFNNLSGKHLDSFKKRTLYHSPDGLYGVTYDSIDKTICTTIEQLLNISEVYTISFCIDTCYFGGTTIFIPKDDNSPNLLTDNYRFTIESIAAQASIALSKLHDSETLSQEGTEFVITHPSFNQLVYQVNDIVWIANGDGSNLIDLNASFNDYFGFTAEQVNQNPNIWIDSIHPNDKESVEKSNEDLYTFGNTECEYRIIKPDGSITWLHERKSIVYNNDGKPVKMGGIASDTTEKKLLEEQLRIKDYALENSPNAVILINPDGVITYVNKSYLTLFEYEHEKEILGKNIKEFSSPVNYNNTLDIINKKGVYTTEKEHARNDGSRFNTLILASSVMGNTEAPCIMVIFINITEMKTLEANLKNSEAKLARLNNDKDRFFTIIAHDLKSPFNGILGLLKILSENYHDYSDEQRINIINASQASSQKAYTLLLDLLEWARLQSGNIGVENEELNISEIIKNNINLYSNESEIKKIVIINNIDPCSLAIVDRNSINTLIRNLFINAIKFTHNQGRITFDFADRQHAFELSISDTGRGMSKETLNKLFKLHENVSTIGTNNEKGTGLGLLICNEIIIKNKWKLNIESQLEIGTTFRILIPKKANQ